ncbi:MAG TPA: nuclear transport factor 2 family protein [Rhizomicrobium sp.]
MKSVLEAWGEADMGPVRAALAEDVVWKCASSFEGGEFCFGGVYRGRNNVLALLSKISTSYYFQRYVTKEIVSKGEIVWGLFDVSASYVSPRGTERDRELLNFEAAYRWRIRDGKILEAQTFFDTAAFLVQQGALLAKQSARASSLSP